MGVCDLGAGARGNRGGHWLVVVSPSLWVAGGSSTGAGLARPAPPPSRRRGGRGAAPEGRCGRRAGVRVGAERRARPLLESATKLVAPPRAVVSSGGLTKVGSLSSLGPTPPAVVDVAVRRCRSSDRRKSSASSLVVLAFSGCGRGRWVSGEATEGAAFV